MSKSEVEMTRAEKRTIQVLFDRNWQMHVGRGWPEAHLVITCLVAKFAGHGNSSGGRARRNLKLSLDLEIARENQHSLIADRDLLRFRV